MVKLYQKFEQTESNLPATPEQQLWISVVSKAAHDAIHCSDWREARLAMSWFKKNSKDFKEVCEYAGYNPEYVYSHMKKPIEKREGYMECIRSGNRYYVKGDVRSKLPNGTKVYHSHYRMGEKYRKKKQLSGNAWYKSQRKKNPRYVEMEKLGGRPRIYNHV